MLGERDWDKTGTENLVPVTSLPNLTVSLADSLLEFTVSVCSLRGDFLRGNILFQDDEHLFPWCLAAPVYRLIHVSLDEFVKKLLYWLACFEEESVTSCKYV